jgi:heterodisulfide reductase subunit D
MGIFGFGKGKTLYYPGCLTKGVLKEQFENYKEIFNRLGIDFVLLSGDEMCCGLPVLNAGYRKDVKVLAQKNYDLFKAKGITKIVTNCPSCYHTFKDVYPKMVRDWDLEVEHATVTILNRLLKKGIKFRGADEEKELVMYHDPCHLGRYSGIYEEPRKVIEMLGGKVLEFHFNRENAICCGGGGGVRANYPEIAKAIAKKKASFIPEEIGTPKGVPPAQMAPAIAGKVGKVISPCGLCYANLKSGTDKSVEFSDFVVRKLRGLRR